MSAQDSRDNAALGHALSRARQPKKLIGTASAAGGASRAPNPNAQPVVVIIQMEQSGISTDYGRSSMSDAIDASRWNYVGVSQLPRQCNGGRNLEMQSACGAYEWFSGDYTA